MSAPDRDAGPKAPLATEPSQLALLQVGAPAWRLDRRTCEIGRLGVAAARKALQRAGTAEDHPRRPAQAA